MAASGDISVAQDGGHGNVKLHPYLITLVRWCVSCIWSTANVLLHRLLTTPLQPITGPKLLLPPKPRIPKRVAGKEHLHPEPKVECQLLHQPEKHTLDVIFVHGLYGSLGNTWRQGDWRLKYKTDPQKVTLRNHTTQNACNCQKSSYNDHIYNENKCDDNITDLNDPEMTLKKINEKLSKKVIPAENELITEQFYNNTLLDQVEIIDNYDTQAKFVSDLFKKENACDNKTKNVYKITSKHNKQENTNETNNENKCDTNKSDNGYKCDFNQDNDYKCKYNEINECKCNSNEKKCETGCGCVCNNCYSTCWPRDWIKMDFPGARVISINYTSDPYLWRPLWIKENKRLNLYQRAEQMIEQLLEMGVGEKPIIWVGHSKGGLFIKQIYCEAFEAYMKTNKNLKTNDQTKDNIVKKIEDSPNLNETRYGITADNIDTIIGHFSHNEQTNNSIIHDNGNRNSDNDNRNNHNDNRNNDNDNYTGKNDNYTRNDDNYTENYDNYANKSNIFSRNSDNYTKSNNNYIENNGNYIKKSDNHTRVFFNDNIGNRNTCVLKERNKCSYVYEQINIAKNECANKEYVSINSGKSVCNYDNGINSEKILTDTDLENNNGDEVVTSSIKEEASVARRASLWSASRGFMFYSVPHRGSPLADIKTPVTARSVDLLEIAKDCPLVLELQSRWERASGGGGGGGSGGGGGCGRVSVRGLVETCRTLMSVLWLRIVSADSADAGIGTLSGISVDHREICKPSSRSCLLYTELTDLIHDALKCRCQ